MLPLFASAAFAGLLTSQAYASSVIVPGPDGLDGVTGALDGLNLGDLNAAVKRSLLIHGLDALAEVTYVFGKLPVDSTLSATPSSTPNK